MNKNNKKNSLNSNKTFGILFFIIFFLYGIWPIFYSNELRTWSLTIGIIFLILGLLKAKILTPLNIIWIKFGELLGKIVSPVTMAIIYFLIITPMAIFIRLLGIDLLKIKFQNSPSYWITRDKKTISMKKQF